MIDNKIFRFYRRNKETKMLVARAEKPEDTTMLKEIASKIPLDEKLLSFNEENYNKFLTEPNFKAYIYLTEEADTDLSKVGFSEVIGVGLLKIDASVGYVNNRKIIYRNSNNELIKEDNPEFYYAKTSNKNFYIGGAWISPNFRKKGYYTGLFKHRFELAKELNYELELKDGFKRDVITEPFGSRSEDGFGVIDCSRKSSMPVYELAMRNKFKHVGFSVEWDMGPTLVYSMNEEYQNRD